MRASLRLWLAALAVAAASLPGCRRSPSVELPTQPPPSAYEGTLDIVGPHRIEGWAWDRRRPQEPVSVGIYDGATLLVTVVADKHRADLSKGGKGDGNHGFKVDTPPALRDGKEHTVRALISGTQTELKKSPKTITLPAKP
jgi:hypothetical protein